MQEKRDRIICFSTTQSQYDAIRKAALSKDSLSSLLREIVAQYLANLSQPDQPKP